MKEKEFVVWLDGAINLGQQDSFNAKQTSLIKENLYSLEDKGTFTSWLKGFYETMEPVEIDAKNVVKINQKLQDEMSQEKSNTKPSTLTYGNGQRC